MFRKILLMLLAMIPITAISFAAKAAQKVDRGHLDTIDLDGPGSGGPTSQ